MRRLTSWPDLRSVTVALGTSLRPAARALVAVGPEADVAVAVVVGAAARVVADVAVRGVAAADLVGAGVRGAGAAGLAAMVVVVDDVSSCAAVDGLVGTAPAVADVVESARAVVALSPLPPPLQAEPTRTRAAAKAACRKSKGRFD